MKQLIFSVCILISASAFSVPNIPQWGKTGHRATAEIAAKYLSPKAQKAVEEILDGDQMALVANFGDDIKSDHQYDKYKVWHYLNIPEGKELADISYQDGDNAFTAIEACKKGILDAKTTHEEKQFYLKMLIHIIGDIHQPLHLGHEDDRGGNSIKVLWFNEQTNLHAVWDDKMLDSYEMSYTELANTQRKLTLAQIAAIQKGNVVDWINETHVITNKIYNSAKDGDRLWFNYMYDWMPTVREQVNKGGIRLAKVLNDLFK